MRWEKLTLAITKKTDYSARDRNGKLAFYVLLSKRKGIKIETLDEYWKNVHGPVCARLPGQHQYWQYHVSHNQGDLWPVIDGINYDTASTDQVDGIAELTFATESDRQTWFKASSILMGDEHNIFSKAIGYNTNFGNSKTYVDRLDKGNPNGSLGVLKFHVMVRKTDGASTDAFRNYMTNTFASNVVQSDSVLKLRLHLFEEIDNSRADAAKVSHFESAEKQYQAAFEIAFLNSLEMQNFFASEEYKKAVKDQADYVKQISPFPERSVYTFVYDGQMTLAGQRSSRVAELITQIGATNQLKEDIVSLMNGTTSIANGKQNGTTSASNGKHNNQTSFSISNFSSTVEQQSPRLPGEAADIVKQLFSRGESFDGEGFASFFTDNPVYQFGNFDVCFDKDAILKSSDNFDSKISAVYHEIKMMWEVGDVVFVEMDVTYWRNDGSVITLPCFDIFRFEGNKIAELRIFMDVNPVFDPKIKVSDTASVMTLSQGKRLTPVKIMKKFYAENEAGKQRITEGFIPKWSFIKQN